MTQSTLLKQIKSIKCLILDVDGVLTDGRITLDNQGNESKTFNVQDGLGLKLIQKANIIPAIISKRASQAVIIRAQELNIQHVYLHQSDKIAAFNDLLATLNITADQCAYAGDDLPDIPVMQQVGFSIAVANAATEVKNIADWETIRSGGHGAVRDICNLLLQKPL